MKREQIKIFIAHNKIVIIISVSSILFWVVGIGASSQTSFLLSEVTLSVVVTLVIVERIIRKDRERQWERVKFLTYTAILTHLSTIALAALAYIVDSWEYVIEDIIGRDFHKPNKDVAIAIVTVAKLIDKDITSIELKTNPASWDSLSKQEQQLYEEFQHDYAMAIESYYNEIKPILNDIRSILIPRVLQLSNNQEVNEALLKFESTIRLFDEAIRVQKRFENFSPTARWQIPHLLKEAGVLYDILQYEIQNTDKSTGK